MGIQRVGDLDIDENLDFQVWQWRFERVGWGLLALIVLLALLGLFGGGPISSVSAGSDAGGLTVEYQRFIRQEGEDELIVTVDARHARDGQVELWISGTYLDAIAVTGFSPEPVEQSGDDGRVVYRFALAEGATSLTIDIDYAARSVGRLSARIGTGPETSVTFHQFSYP